MDTDRTRRMFEDLEQLLLDHRLEEAIDYLARLTWEEIRDLDREFQDRDRLGDMTLPPAACRPMPRERG